MLLENKIAIIIGGGRGIGRLIALGFAKEGAELLLISRTKEELRKVAKECSQHNNKTNQFCVLDITDLYGIDELMEFHLKKLDILVISSGMYGPIGETKDILMYKWIDTINTNLIAPVYLCQKILPLMIKQGHGKIILLGGGGASKPMPNFSAYAASKSGLVRFAETLAKEVEQYNIQVNVIAPGLVYTKLQEEILKAGENVGELYKNIELAKKGLMGTTGKEAIGLALFLASNKSKNLTGRLISAIYDNWKDWNDNDIEEINNSSMYTLRRMDLYNAFEIDEYYKAFK